jgi:hypothetical protein
MKLDQLKSLMWAWFYYDESGTRHKCLGRHDAKTESRKCWKGDWENHIAYEII